MTDAKVIRFDEPLSPEEWRSIISFRQRAENLQQSTYFASDASLGAELKGDSSGIVSSSASGLPSDDSLAALLLAFRHFYINDEPASFLKVLNILPRHNRHPDLVEFCKNLKERWQKALFGGLMKMSLDDDALNAQQILDLWLNGHYFHTDAIKAKKLEALASVLGADFVKFMLVDVVSRCSVAILMLNSALRDLVAPEDML